MGQMADSKASYFGAAVGASSLPQAANNKVARSIIIRMNGIFVINLYTLLMMPSPSIG
jgi:hypothetical protein